MDKTDNKQMDKENGTKNTPTPSKQNPGDEIESHPWPRCLQCFHKIQWFVLIMCVFGFVEGASINGFISSSLSTIEKRFHFQSSQSGLIVSSADIGATCLVLFVSFYGAKGHKPRVIGTGCLVMALGCFLLFLPHLLVGTYEYSTDGNEAGHVCDVNRTGTCTNLNDQSSSPSLLPVFAIGQALQGIGFTPAFTVGTEYIDENSTPEKTAFYMGLIYALTALGVAAGFISGGQFLNLWVDVGRTDVDSVTIDVNDRRWIGAWWIGFVIAGILYVLLLLPLCAFPRKMPNSDRVSKQNGTSPIKSKNPKDELAASLWKRMLSLPKAVFQLLRKPTFLLLVLVGALETLVIQGFASFSVKILEDKFDLDASDGSLLVGLVTVVGGAGGMVAGGVIIEKFHLNIKGIARFCMAMCLLAFAFGGGFFLNCPESKFAGLTSSFGANGLDATCNLDCNCRLDEFDPVCGDDGVTYFSPCHAGCDDNLTIESLIRTYNNCSCVAASFLRSPTTTTTTATTSPSPMAPSAVNGTCVKDCPIVWLFVVLLFGALTATFLTVTPMSVSILRCVPEDKRSLGLGLQWVALRLLGTIPGPVLTGTVLDTTCTIWQTTCEGQGNCWLYDRYSMGGYLFAWWGSVKASCFLLLAVVLWLNRDKAVYQPTAPANCVTHF